MVLVQKNITAEELLSSQASTLNCRTQNIALSQHVAAFYKRGSVFT